MRVGQTEASRLGLLEAFPLPRSLPKLSDPLSCPAPPHHGTFQLDLSGHSLTCDAARGLTHLGRIPVLIVFELPWESCSVPLFLG